MTKELQPMFREWEEVIIAFANTGEEHPKTLEYVENADREYGFGVVWLEAVFDPKKGAGTRHRVVNFKTASRNGEPFESMVAKHGLPNSQFPHCTRETKLYPIRSYLRSRGWEAGSYNTAIGIRADEVDRISPKSIRDGALYPLIDWGITKEDVLAWELKEPVRLGIPEHYGNCKWCWKKSFRKLATVSKEMPEAFKFPAYLEARYRDHGPGFGDRRLFRGRKSTADIFALARDPAFEPFVDGFPFKDETMDQGSSCGESCEIGVDGAFDEGLTPELDYSVI
jgi:hypothetical protein